MVCSGLQTWGDRAVLGFLRLCIKVTTTVTLRVGFTPSKSLSRPPSVYAVAGLCSAFEYRRSNCGSLRNVIPQAGSTAKCVLSHYRNKHVVDISCDLLLQGTVSLWFISELATHRPTTPQRRSGTDG